MDIEDIPTVPIHHLTRIGEIPRVLCVGVIHANNTAKAKHTEFSENRTLIYIIADYFDPLCVGVRRVFLCVWNLLVFYCLSVFMFVFVLLLLLMLLLLLCKGKCAHFYSRHFYSSVSFRFIWSVICICCCLMLVARVVVTVIAAAAATTTTGSLSL